MILQEIWRRVMLFSVVLVVGAIAVPLLALFCLLGLPRWHKAVGDAVDDYQSSVARRS